jgi:hypothetical protein
MEIGQRKSVATQLLSIMIRKTAITANKMTIGVKNRKCPHVPERMPPNEAQMRRYLRSAIL